MHVEEKARIAFCILKCLLLAPFLVLHAGEIVVDGDTDISAADADTVLTVNSGTATLLSRAQRGYRHYRFKVERPYGTSAKYVAFSEFRLFDGASRHGELPVWFS